MSSAARMRFVSKAGANSNWQPVCLNAQKATEITRRRRGQARRLEQKIVVARHSQEKIRREREREREEHKKPEGRRNVRAFIIASVVVVYRPARTRNSTSAAAAGSATPPTLRLCSPPLLMLKLPSHESLSYTAQSLEHVIASFLLFFYHAQLDAFNIKREGERESLSFDFLSEGEWR